MCVPRQLSVGGLTKDGLPFGANAKFNQQGRETCLPFVLFLSQGFCTKLITQWLICFCRAITANVYRRLWQVWVSCDFTVLVRAYACLLACLDRPLTVTLPALILCILWHALIQRGLEDSKDMNHEQSTSSMATTRTETTHGLTYSVSRAMR